MSASNCPETPRQKMIQMMYLVYTAMLALNVSAEVVNGFVTVGDAMDKSNVSVSAKIDDSYATFEEANKNNPEKTQEAYNKALEVKALSNEMKAYIDTLQGGFLCFLQAEAEGVVHDENGKKSTVKVPLRKENFDPNDFNTFLIDSAMSAMRKYGLEVIAKKDNNNDGTRYFFRGSEAKSPDPNCPAEQLKTKIINYKKRLKSILGDDSSKVQLAMNVEGQYYSEHAGEWVSWEQMNFDNTITIADMVVLSRMRAEVMTAEYDAVNMLYNQVKAGDFSFDKVAVITRPKATYITQGGKYELVINVGAYDSKQHFTANVGGTTMNSNDTGAVVYTATCGTVGPKTVSGTVYMKNEKGTQEYPFKESYFVAAPMAVVSLTNMMVVYAGVDNPFSVSVPGVDSRAIEVKVIEGEATIKSDPEGKQGDYILFTSKTAGKVKLAVNAKIDGKVSQMGTSEFRVKKIPTPVVKIGKYNSGATIPLAELRAAKGISAKPDNFDFKMKQPQVVSFKFNYSGSGKQEIEVKGGNWGPEVKPIIDKLPAGKKIYIEDVKVKMADGSTQTIEGGFRIGR